MVFYIDEQLPKKLYPLAWLVGDWKGFGVFKYDGKSFKVPPTEVDQTVSFSYDKNNDYLKYESKTVKKGTDEILIEENGFWIVSKEIENENATKEKSSKDKKATTSEKNDGAKKQDDAPSFQVDVLLSSSTGYSSVLEGIVGSGKIELASSTLARLKSPFQIAGEKRMYGYVKEKLFGVQEVSTKEDELKPFLSMELSRVEKK